MIKLPNKENCCGCGACLVACPKQAISMSKDKYGFDFPTINYDMCVGCGKCISVCCFNNNNLFCKENIKAYAAVSRDSELLSNSTSGGVFATVAKMILEKDGLVYGAVWNEDFSVEHIEIDNPDELYKMQGSKYTQSNVYKIFSTVKENLLNNRKVLFSGTPCQVAALYSYLGKDYNNLYTMDLVCHGVASNQMLQDDIKYFEKKLHEKAVAVSFRTKEKGWGTSGSIELTNRQVLYDISSSPYYYFYLSNTIFRESCYNCRFAGGPRQGDLTIGDYWKIETAHPNIAIDETKGISCVLVNSYKGGELVEACEENLILIESTFEKIKDRNGQLVAPCKIPETRNSVLELYAQREYDKVVLFWKKNSRKARFLEKIKRIIPKHIKKIMKRMV